MIQLAIATCIILTGIFTGVRYPSNNYYYYRNYYYYYYHNNYYYYYMYYYGYPLLG